METLREPYTALRYLAERIDLPKILQIKLDESKEGGGRWTPIMIAE